MSRFKYKLHGMQETISRLANFQTRFKRKALTKAGNAGSKIAFAGLKANAPKQTGSWRKSLGRKVKVFNGGTVLWYAVGPRSAWRYNATIKAPPGMRVRPIKKSKHWPDGTPAVFWRNPRTGKIVARPLTKPYRPVLYSHLIEKGTKYSRALRMISQSQHQTRQREMAAIAQSLRETATEI